MERRTPADPFAELFGDDPRHRAGDRWRPAVDVCETEKSVVVRVEIAGVRSDELRVAVEGELLCIRGSRRPPRESGEVLRHHQLEIELGPFEARIRIPVPFERGAVEARLEDGVLCVRLPKRGPRRIEVQGSGTREGS